MKFLKKVLLSLENVEHVENMQRKVLGGLPGQCHFMRVQMLILEYIIICVTTQNCGVHVHLNQSTSRKKSSQLSTLDHLSIIPRIFLCSAYVREIEETRLIASWQCELVLTHKSKKVALLNSI